MAGGKIDILVEPDTRGFAAKLGVGLRAASGVATAAGQAVGLALVAGAVAASAGLKKVIELGIEYQNSLNTLQAVTGATADEMARVGAVAKELGSDLSLPATSAVDAAAAMTELAKGGLTVEQAMAAARGTLQLAAAAQIDAASAATIQSNALNTFSLSAEQASRVADVLANAANASSGEITDFADAFQQGGAVAAQFGMSIEDTATSLALLANRGIQGSDAGTLLKSALLALTRDTKPTREAMKELGLTVFDATGNFVGMESVFNQLRDASGRMTQEQYAQATATLFGSDAVRLAGVAASTTGEQWDSMSDAIGRSGGAAEVAAAKTKGVGGALEGIKSQLETIGLTIFDSFDEPLEAGLRKFAGFLDEVGTKLEDLSKPGAFKAFLDENIAALSAFGERIGIDYGAAIDFVKTKAAQIQEIGGNVYAGLKPIVEGAIALFDSFRQNGGVFDTVATGMRLFGDAVVAASGVLKPIGEVIGNVLQLFADLPAPVQAAILTFAAMKGLPALADNLGTSIGALITTSGPLGTVLGSAIDGVIGAFRRAGDVAGSATGGIRQFSDEMRVQRALAEQAGESLSTYEAAQAAFETSSAGPIESLREFRDAFEEIKAGAEGAGEPVSDLSAAIEAFAEQNDTVAALRDSYVGASDGVKAFGSSVEEAATKAATALSDRLIGATNRTADAIRGLPAQVSGIGSAIAGAVRAAVDVVASVPDRVSQAASAMRDGLASAAETAGNVFSSAADYIGEFGDQIKDVLTNLGPRVGSAFRSMGTAIRGGLTSAVGAVRSFGSAVATGFGSAVAAVGAFPARIAGAVSAIRTSIGGIPGMFRTAFTGIGSGIAAFGRSVQTGIVGAFRAIPGAVAGGVGALANFAARAAGIGATIGTGVVRGLGGLVGFLGGPWGVALMAAQLGLQLFAKRQGEAARAAADHKGAIEELKGTLDQYTGAITEATVAEQAKDIAARKLSDGTTSFATALRGAGIDLKDYTEAAAGNADKLGLVNAQLFIAAQRTPAMQELYAKWKPRLDEAGVSFETLTAAAIGNGGAFDELTTKLGVSGSGLEIWRQDLDAAVGPLGELGSALGTYNQQVTEAQEQTRLAAEASKNFDLVLTGIKDGIAGLAGGAAATAVLAAGFVDLATTAGAAATRAGEAAEKIGGIEAGALAAGRAMGESRTKFVEAATAAGLTAEQAEALATSIGLIPAAAETVFRTNAAGVEAEFITLAAQVAAVPGAKQITVNALSEEAQQKLRDLGFTVTTLPNGQILIDAKDEAGRAKLNQFLADSNAAVASITLDANADPATGKVNGTVAFGNGQIATITVDANNQPADGKIQASVTFADGSTGTVTIDGNQQPVNGKITASVQYANGSVGTIRLNPNDLVTPVINRLKQPTSSTHTIRVTSTGQPIGAYRGAAQGGVFTAMAEGGMIGFAKGGIPMGGRKLTPMSGRIADIIPPNTWRVIGDRLVDDEAYIPINKSRRSQAIFKETARRMGYSVARMYADGGFAGSSAFQSQLRSMAAASLRGGGNAQIVAALASLAARLEDVKRSVVINNQINNPLAERGSDTLARLGRRQAAMGMFE